MMANGHKDLDSLISRNSLGKKSDDGRNVQFASRKHIVSITFVCVTCFISIFITVITQSGHTDNTLNQKPLKKKTLLTECAYEILTESFQDTSPKAKNGFLNYGYGVGDFKGIQARLNFVKRDVQCKVLYINSMYESNDDDHMVVVNHTNVDSLFGTMEDFNNLLKDAKRNGMFLIIDFIPNHTGKLSEWFKKSQRKEGKYTDYYIWAFCDPKNDLYPNNWLSVRGGRAWTYDNVRKECFYHQLEEDKPELNLWNHDVQRELEIILHFWLKKGVDGFHVLNVEYLYEDPKLGDEVLTSGKRGNAYGDFEHTKTVNHPQNDKILQAWRGVLDTHKTIQSRKKLLIISAGDDLNATIRNSDDGGIIVRVDLLPENEASLPENIETILKNYASMKNIGWMLSDKYSSRLASKEGPQKAKALLTLQSTLPGIAFNYYGNEIGMTDNPNVSIPRRFRTPMQWNSAGTGFSKNRPWVPRNPNYSAVNVETESAIGDDFTIFKVYKRLQELRESESLQRGKIKVLRDGDLLMYTRKAEGFPGYLVVINFGSRKVTKSLYREMRIQNKVRVVFHSHKHDTIVIDLSKTSYVLGPNHAVIFEYDYQG